MQTKTMYVKNKESGDKVTINEEDFNEDLHTKIKTAKPEDEEPSPPPIEPGNTVQRPEDEDRFDTKADDAAKLNRAVATEEIEKGEKTEEDVPRHKLAADTGKGSKEAPHPAKKGK